MKREHVSLCIIRKFNNVNALLIIDTIKRWVFDRKSGCTDGERIRKKKQLNFNEHMHILITFDEFKFNAYANSHLT